MSDDLKSDIAYGALGAVSADTLYNAPQLYRDATKMTAIHNQGIDDFLAGGLRAPQHGAYMDQYADAAGKAIQRRIGGIPAHVILGALTPSARVGPGEYVEHYRAAAGLGGKSSPSIEHSKNHYRMFRDNPRLAMLREVAAFDPTLTSIKDVHADYKPLFNEVIGGRRNAKSKGMTELSRLMKGEAPIDMTSLSKKFKTDRGVSGLFRNAFEGFYLNGQNSKRNFSRGQALNLGLGAYARFAKPGAAIAALAGAVGLGSAVNHFAGGQTKSAKIGGVGKLLKSVFSQPALLGSKIQQEALKGVRIHHPGLGEGGLFNKLTSVLRNPSVKEQSHIYDYHPIPKEPGVNVDFVGRGAGGRAKNRNFVGRYNIDKQRKSIANSKIAEAEAFPELIAKTDRLSDAVTGLEGVDPNDHAAVFEALRAARPEGFIVKPDGGFATAGSSLVTDSSSFKDFASMRSKGMKGAHGDRFAGGDSNFVIQERLPLQSVSRVERAANNIAEMKKQDRFGALRDVFSSNKQDRGKAHATLGAMFGGKLPFKAQGSMSGGNMREYRMAVIDGKVVPYATVGRGSILGALPIRTPGAAGAEKFLAAELGKMDPSRLKGTYGFDVAKLKGGGYKVIETNPSTEGGSGMTSFPHVQDAIAAALQGRLPRYVKAQYAALTGLPVAAAGAYALSGESSPDKVS